MADVVGAGVVAGADGRVRCAWGASPADYVSYHDSEWGRPVVDEVRLFEKLCLEGFQAGLSWLTILRKRPAFRQAFADFRPEVVAGFTDTDVQRLLGDAGIVRHRGKIEAAIDNARAVVRLWDDGGTLAGLVWHHEPADRALRSFAQVPAQTPESAALSKALKRRGFRFVGPTTCYAAMQAVGVVNDHVIDCHAHAGCHAARRALVRPTWVAT
jgi:DNA-3-methyladenine glycosylase I